MAKINNSFKLKNKIQKKIKKIIKKISLNHFYLEKNLGKGSFDSVQIVYRKSDNKYYAMKRI